MKNLFLCIFILGTSTLASPAQSYFPEAGNWQAKAPKELGLDAGKLQEAIRFAQTHESAENPNLKIAHYESGFGREPFGYPVGPMKERGSDTQVGGGQLRIVSTFFGSTFTPSLEMRCPKYSTSCEQNKHLERLQ